MKKTLLLLILTFLFSFRTYAQVEDRLGFLLENDLTGFAQPLATSIGTAFNSGGYYDAYVPKLFGFSIGVKGMIILIPDDQKTFTPKNLPPGYTADKPTATIYGDKGAVYSGPLGYLAYPAGLNQSSVPMVFPQASISFMGTELMVRYLPTFKVDEEEISLFGFGIKHSISQYIPLIPVNIAVQFLYNTFSISDIVDVKNTAFNVHASKSLGVLTVYGGLQLESSTVDFKYTFKDPNGLDPAKKNHEISMSIDGNNKFRMTVGGALNLAFFVINADYSLGSQGVLTTGLTFQF